MLDGVRVLDLTALLPGAVATQLLADLGAEVIKVERPGGDPMRSMLPGWFEAVNRGKRSTVADLKNDADVSAVRRLAASCDVAVEGWRPGVAARLGIGADDLVAVNPSIVYCSISGFGQDGPYDQLPGHDLNYLGLAAAIEQGAGADTRLDTELPIADTLAGYGAAVAILAALSSGGPKVIDLAMADVVLNAMAPILNGRYVRHRDSGPGHDGPLPAYTICPTADGDLVTVCCTEDVFWARLCDLLDLEELGADESLSTWTGRAGRSEEIEGRIRARVRMWTSAELTAEARRRDIPCAVVNDADAVAADQQVQHRRLLACDDHGLHVGFPAWFDGVPIARRTGPPDLGEFDLVDPELDDSEATPT